MIITQNQEAIVKVFEDLGFVNTRGDKITETDSSRSTMLVAPSGFGITLTQHIKK